MTTTVIVLVVVLLLVAALRLWMTANRLDRLHVRTEAAWVGAGGRAGPADGRHQGGGRGRRPPDPEQAAELRGAPRTRPTAPIGPTGPTPRTTCRAPSPRSRPPSRTIWPANWPTPASGWCWPAGSTTTRCGTPAPCGRSGSPGSSGWPAAPAAGLLRDGRAGTRRHPARRCPGRAGDRLTPRLRRARTGHLGRCPTVDPASSAAVARARCLCDTG